MFFIKMYHVLIKLDGEIFKNYYFNNFSQEEIDKIFDDINSDFDTTIYFFNINTEIYILFNFDDISTKNFDKTNRRFIFKRIFYSISQTGFIYKDRLNLIENVEFNYETLINIFKRHNFTLDDYVYLW